MVNGSCEIKPSQSWCEMHIEDLDYVAIVGNKCTSTVSQQDNQLTMNMSESSTWIMSDMGKLI